MNTEKNPEISSESNDKTNHEPIIMLLPQIDNQTEIVEIAYWLKKDGSLVQKDEPLCEVETEEFAFELTASESGILRIIAKNGTMLKIGEAVCEILVERVNEL